jgi:hypothetical protein
VYCFPLQDGGAAAVACLTAPRAYLGFFASPSLLPLYSPLVLVDSTAFFLINYRTILNVLFEVPNDGVYKEGGGSVCHTC